MRNNAGYLLEGRDIAEGPREEVIDQIFRCTNSPVFHAGNETTEDLCRVQKVAVLVNRLRDRRIAYLLDDLAQRNVCYFWMSGPLHYETLLNGLQHIAAEYGLVSRNMQARLGLVAIRSSSADIGTPLL